MSYDRLQSARTGTKINAFVPTKWHNCLRLASFSSVFCVFSWRLPIQWKLNYAHERPNIRIDNRFCFTRPTTTTVALLPARRKRKSIKIGLSKCIKSMASRRITNKLYRVYPFTTAVRWTRNKLSHRNTMHWDGNNHLDDARYIQQHFSRELTIASPYKLKCQDLQRRLSLLFRAEIEFALNAN